MEPNQEQLAAVQSTADGIAESAAAPWKDRAYRAGMLAVGGRYVYPNESNRAISVMLPEGARHEIVDLEDYAATPYMKRGLATFYDAASFARYVNAHKGPGTAIAFVRALGETLPSVSAVLDYHVPGSVGGLTAGSPGWGVHRAGLAFRHSRACAAWLKIHGKALTHAEFAEFLEDHVADVAEPDGATLLELARRFEVTREASFSSVQNLANGTASLAYVEAENRGPSAAVIPSEFVLGLAPFEGDPLYRVTARFRYKVNAGKLSITVKLHRIEDVLDQAVADRVAAIHAATGIEPFFGSVATVEAIRG
jgi:uncharacterized protein YfdQ (DUF2303 family)